MVPGDALLIFGAALALATLWIGKRSAPWFLTALRVFAYPLIVLGIGLVAFSLVDVYMVKVAHVTPGEPMGMDELAYPVRGALLDIAKGIGLLVLAFFFRDYARRKRLSAGR